MAEGDRANGIEISFDASRCLHVRSVWANCSLCIDSCPSASIFTQEPDRLPQLDLEKCLNCGQCLSACPLDAFSSPRFSERKLLSRVEPISPLRLRCFMPYGEAEVLDAAKDYQLGACLAAITPGGLAEMAFSKQCTLVVDRCKECQLYERVWTTLQCNEETAYALLADWGRAGNLRESTPLFLPVTEVEPVTSAPQPVASFGESASAKNGGGSVEGVEPAATVEPVSPADPASPKDSTAPDLSDNIKSSIRALFHGRRRKREAKERQRHINSALKLQAKRRHVPFWRSRLEELWRANKPQEAGSFPWPKQTVDEGLCRACGVCMQLCPTGAIRHKLEDGMFTYSHVPGHCTNCGLCIESCLACALERDYQNMTQPFDEQVCVQWPAHACKRCGLPAREGTGDLCLICVNEPDPKPVADRIRSQMVKWLRGEGE